MAKKKGKKKPARKRQERTIEEVIDKTQDRPDSVMVRAFKNATTKIDKL